MKTERYFRPILKKWWVIVLLEIIALSATFYFVTTQAETYTSTATLILNPRNTNPIIPYTISDNASVESVAETYNLVLKSEGFLTQVASHLGFPVSLLDLKKAFTSKLTPNTFSYNIIATSTTPERAQKIASSVTQVFLANQNNDTKVTALNEAATTLQTQKEQLKTLDADIVNLNNQLKDLQAQPDTTETQSRINTLTQRRRDLLDTQSRTVLAIAQLESSTKAADTNYALLLNEANFPTLPDNSNLLRNLIFTFALALALGTGAILLLNYLDTSIQSEEDLEGIIGKASFSQIPEIMIKRPAKLARTKTKDKTFAAVEASQELALRTGQNAVSDLLVTLKPDYSLAAEAYRTLRTTVLFSKPQDKDRPEKLVNPAAKSFLVTSALPGEGRSLTAANLAIAFAQTGKKVILIDSDLRHPSLHVLFNLPNEIGFSDLALSGITKLTKAVHSTAIQNLVVVTAGNILLNPSELLTSAKAGNVIKFFKNIADIVIFDSPPASPVTDAAILANMVDQVVLVVQYNVSLRKNVAETVLELTKVGANIENVVLNRVKGIENKKLKKYFAYQSAAREKKPSKDKVIMEEQKPSEEKSILEEGKPVPAQSNGTLQYTKPALDKNTAQNPDLNLTLSPEEQPDKERFIRPKSL
ncbi:MAG: non-specific protein-tyrosine kinase [Chloroflexi bacterium]|nr:non-specific protein-tyrosine kinase [Chloroflexota bacterium]